MLCVHWDKTQEKYLSGATSLAPDVLFAAQQAPITSYQPTEQNKMGWKGNTNGVQPVAGERDFLICRCTLETLQTTEFFSRPT